MQWIPNRGTGRCSSSPVLQVRDLSVAFGHHKDGQTAENPVQVTDRVSFEINAGEFFALVGESGCGKSVTAMGILRLLPWPGAQIVNGSVLYCAKEGEAPVDLTKIPLADLQKVRGSGIACIFQEPMQALDPVVTIRKQLLEVFKFSGRNEREVQIPGQARNDAKNSARNDAESQARNDAKNSARNDAQSNARNDVKGSRARENTKEKNLAEIREMLLLAGFKDPDRVLDSYPHELSGGMLQRVCIVMALLPKPKLIIADEPTTALDVTVQAQVLAVLKDMANRTGTAVLLITHNMGIVSQYADRVAVMYAGRIVECGPVRDVIDSPMHPYTQGLLAAIPENHSDMRNLRSIPGSVPHARDFVKGCRFADRCEKCMNAPAEIQARCRSNELPPCVGEGAPHYANCFLAADS